MYQLSNLIQAAALLVLAVASPTFLHPTNLSRDIKLSLLDIYSSEGLTAIYTAGNLQFNLTSRVQSKVPLSWAEPDSVSYIVSMISAKKMDRKESPAVMLSQIVIPGKYMFQRKVPDMEKRIIHAAKDLLEVSKTAPLKLTDLVNLLDAIIDDLAPKIDMQTKFSQSRASVIYHGSVLKAALRLSNGVTPDSACPGHQAYQHKGLFACQQEYNLHAQAVMASPLFGCKDPACVQNLDRSLGSRIEKEISGRDVEQAVEVVEEVLSLGSNSKLAEEIARLIACGNISCIEPGCGNWLYTDGWHIDGADWGCCGDYPGCCFLSTETCLIHDAICTCCSFPVFCLDPFCHPDPWCSNMTTTTTPP